MEQLLNILLFGVISMLFDLFKYELGIRLLLLRLLLYL